jgi:hypothetical protein
MTAPAAIFRATYSDFRLVKGRKVVQLVFEVPLEESNKSYEVLGGMPNPAAEVWCAIARLNPETAKEVMPDNPAGPPDPPNDTSPASGPDKVQARARTVDPEKRLAQRAALLCQDKQFQQFLTMTWPAKIIVTEEEAAAYVRIICVVDSRSEIKPGTEAGRRFDNLYYRFTLWRDADIYLEAQA